MDQNLEFFINDIATIKHCLFILLVFMTISVINNIVRSIFYIKTEIKKAKEDSFKDTVHDYLEQGEIEKAVEMSKRKISTHPNHAYANYALGRSYFMQEKYDDAYDLFKKTINIHPAWEKDFIGPFIERIENKRKNSNTSFSTDKPNIGAPVSSDISRQVTKKILIEEKS